MTLLTDLFPNGIDNVVEDVTPQLGGNLDMNGHNIGGNTEAQIDDAVTKKHTANTDTSLGAQSENLNMNTHKIVGVVDPTADQDVETKKHVADNYVGIGGSNTQVQFNDSGSLAGDSGLIWNKTINKLTVGIHWHAGYPFDSFQPALEGVSEIGEWGVLGASRSSDSAVQDSMRCLGLYGFVYNDSHNSAYGIYTEARKMVSTPNRSTSGAEFVILNRYNSQVDVTQSSNPGQATYGVAITSGTTYDAVTDYDSSVGLFFANVNARFRRGIVMHNASLTDLGSGKYVGIAMPSGTRVTWVNDDNCIYGTSTNIDALIGNTVVTQVTSAGFESTGRIKVGSSQLETNALYLDGSDVSITANAANNNMYFQTGGAGQAILYSTTGNLEIGGTLTENAWTLDKKVTDRKWKLIDSMLDAYKEHDGRYLDSALRIKSGNKWGKRPSDFIQIAIECIAELRNRIKVLENNK